MEDELLLGMHQELQLSSYNKLGFFCSGDNNSSLCDRKKKGGAVTCTKDFFGKKWLKVTIFSREKRKLKSSYFDHRSST
jgi:hypothetical protein